MKMRHIVCMSAAIVLPVLALAELPLPNDIFGRMEANLDMCAQVDPQSAQKYEEQKKALVQGASDDEVAAARASQEYKDSYVSATSELAKQPKDQVAKACAAALETKKEKK